MVEEINHRDVLKRSPGKFRSRLDSIISQFSMLRREVGKQRRRRRCKSKIADEEIILKEVGGCELRDQLRWNDDNV